MTSAEAPPRLTDISGEFQLACLPTLETAPCRFSKPTEIGEHSPVPQRFYSWGKNTFSCFRVHMMKAFEITALLRWGDSCFISSCPGDGVSVEFWGFFKSCGREQWSEPVGLQAQGLSVKSSSPGHPPVSGPLLSSALAWLQSFKGL